MDTLGPLFAVLGPWQGGTSLTAGVLQLAGVAFDLQGTVVVDLPYETHESRDLVAAVRKCWYERPEYWGPLFDRRTRVRYLVRWIDSHRSVPLLGAKYPPLCGLVSELYEACRIVGRQFAPVVVSRPVDQVLASWERRTNSEGGNWWPRPDYREATLDLVERRRESLEALTVPACWVSYEDLRANIAGQGRDLARRLGLERPSSFALWELLQ